MYYKQQECVVLENGKMGGCGSARMFCHIKINLIEILINTVSNSK